MIQEKFKSLLFDKIPQNAKLAIFGACDIGNLIKKDISLYRKDLNLTCFIDNFKTGTYQNYPVMSLKNYVDSYKEGEYVIVASLSAQHTVNNILDIYNIPFVAITGFIMDFYSGKNPELNDDVYYKNLDIYKDAEDKELFDKIFRVRKKLLPESTLVDFYKARFSEIWPVTRTIKNHYIEKINKECVKTVFDLGFHDGVNAIAYNKLLPNLEQIYAFEAIYDYCRYLPIENFILNDKLIIVNSIVGDKKGQSKFYINLKQTYDSYANFSDSTLPADKNKNIKEVLVNVTTIDDYCKENNVYPDFIKTDIEGAEMLALKGGIKTIQKCRPQLAISIYHSNSDFVNIPIYLAENLENYTFKIGLYSPDINEIVLYAIPDEKIY